MSLAERLTVSKFGGGVTRFQSVLQRYSPGFESNDLGFQSRADEMMFRNWFSLNYNTPTKLYTRAFLNFNSMQKWTTEGLPTTIGLNLNWHVQFTNWMRIVRLAVGRRSANRRNTKVGVASRATAARNGT